MNALIARWRTMDATPEQEARVLTEGGSLARIVSDGQVCSLRITRAVTLILRRRGVKGPPPAGSHPPIPPSGGGLSPGS